MMPTVSVIMAVHNGEDHVRDAVDSILAQTLRNLELIIVDDASSDATADVLARYDDPRVHIFRNQWRLGPGAARNRALRIAKAPLVAIQDADDSSLPERLQTQAEFLATNPLVDVIGAHAATILADGSDGEIMRYPPARDLEIKWALLFWNPFIHTSIMLRRSVLQETGAYTEEGGLAWLAEDYELLSRINQKHCAANINQVLVRYRINPAGASARQEDLQQLSAEVSRKNIGWLLGAEAADVETVQALRRFWFEGKPLSPADAQRALAGNEVLHQAFLAQYAQGGSRRFPRARFCLACARRAFSQAWRNSHLERSCRAAMLRSTMALASKAIA